MAPNPKDIKAKAPYSRKDIIEDNPEKFYEFEEKEIGTGKFAVVKKATHKVTGQQYAAKIIKYDDVTILFAKREFEIMKDRLLGIEHKAIPKLHEAYLVRKYMILIMTLCDGKSVLEYFSNRHSFTEDDVASFIRALCQVLHELHSRNIVHLDVRPTNIRMAGGPTEIRLLDYNSARHLPNKKSGTVVDVIGDTEFCAPEMLSFDRVQPPSDMWSVGVITFILLSGISPFYNEVESQVSANVEKAIFSMDTDAWETITQEAQSFIRTCFKINPDMRNDAKKCLEHKWLSEDYTGNRKRVTITSDTQKDMAKTDERLLEEEEEEYVVQSGIFKTFKEDEYISPESSDDEDEED